MALGSCLEWCGRPTPATSSELDGGQEKMGAAATHTHAHTGLIGRSELPRQPPRRRRQPSQPLAALNPARINSLLRTANKATTPNWGALVPVTPPGACAAARHPRPTHAPRAPKGPRWLPLIHSSPTSNLLRGSAPMRAPQRQNRPRPGARGAAGLLRACQRQDNKSRV